MSWRPEETEDGSWTLVHGEHGEACHSRSGAWLEAWERYALGCRLPERARGARRLALLDVGTGLGFNLAAALKALEGSGCELDVVSLELDRTVVEATLELFRDGPAREASERPWEPYHGQVRRALGAALSVGPAEDESVALGPNGRLRLVWGDGCRTLAELHESWRFDTVFLDPFSPPNEPGLWRGDFLGEIARRMTPGAWLATYSASFRVRELLGRAGLRVGLGARVGAKAQGTLASPDREPPALPERTQRRLERALAKMGPQPESCRDPSTRI